MSAIIYPVGITSINHTPITLISPWQHSKHIQTRLMCSMYIIFHHIVHVEYYKTFCLIQFIPDICSVCSISIVHGLSLYIQCRHIVRGIELSIKA